MTNPISIIDRTSHDDYFHPDNLLRLSVSSGVFWTAYQDALARFPRYKNWFITLQVDSWNPREDGMLHAAWRFVVPL